MEAQRITPAWSRVREITSYRLQTHKQETEGCFFDMHPLFPLVRLNSKAEQKKESLALLDET
jgi:hypothetical protein